MIILTEEGAELNHLLTADKRRMLRSKFPSPATSRRNLQVVAVCDGAEKFIVSFLTLISNVIEVPNH